MNQRGVAPEHEARVAGLGVTCGSGDLTLVREDKTVKIVSGQVAVITRGAGCIGFGLAEAPCRQGVSAWFSRTSREEALESAADALVIGG